MFFKNRYNTFEKDVVRFHQKFGCGFREKPAIRLSKQERDERCWLIEEEVNELICAIKSGTLAEIAQECVDVIYVVIGTLVRFGIRITPIWDAIHKANMRKKRMNNWKIQKPEGWKSPNIKQLIKDQS